MARLRYNDVRATLGGSLTNVATAVTFSAALTHSNGTAVPTIGAGDYIPLTILDSSGNLSEIVYLTAYTSGATTGTISRGQESTTAVAHAAGDKIVLAQTAGETRKFAAATRTSGNIIINTTGWQNLDTGLDLTFTGVEAGDVVYYDLALNCNTTANTLTFNVVTVVSGSDVNGFGPTGATDNGWQSWYVQSGTAVNPASRAWYVVTSADLASGVLTLRIKVRGTTTTARTINAIAAAPLKVAAEVWRP